MTQGSPLNRSCHDTSNIGFHMLLGVVQKKTELVWCFIFVILVSKRAPHVAPGTGLSNQLACTWIKLKILCSIFIFICLTWLKFALTAEVCAQSPDLSWFYNLPFFMLSIIKVCVPSQQFTARGGATSVQLFLHTFFDIFDFVRTTNQIRMCSHHLNVEPHLSLKLLWIRI